MGEDQNTDPDTIDTIDSNADSPTSDNVVYHAQLNYEDNSHIFTVFAAMNEMRKIGQLCDITLEAAGVKILAHKVVLAANSAYFNAMFNSKFI